MAVFSSMRPLLYHVDGDLDHGATRALAVTGLQHVEAVLFDGELEILHVLEVVLEFLLNREQLLVTLGHHLFEDLASAGVALGDGLRRADAGHDVFALRIG